MALNKSRVTIANKDSKPVRDTRHLTTLLDDDGDSIRSYADGPQPGKAVRYAWAPGSDKARHGVDSARPGWSGNRTHFGSTCR